MFENAFFMLKNIFSCYLFCTFENVLYFCIVFFMVLDF